MYTKDEVGLGVGDKIPYYGIKLTAEEAKLVEGKIPQIYECNGHSAFNIRGKQGDTGEKMVYVIFV